MKVGSKSSGIAASLLIASLALGASGCGTNQASPSSPNVGPRAQNVAPGGTAAATITDPNAVAAHLEQLAKGIKGVNGANCVVFGKTAIVGIDVDSTLPRSRVGTIKYAVAEAFRKDPYGVDAVVTADMDLGQRLREIREDVANGRPIAGFAEELADIVGRLVPQMPRSVVPPASPDGGNAGVRPMETVKTTPLPNNVPSGTAPAGANRNAPSPANGGGGGGGNPPASAGSFHAQSADTGGGPVVYEKHWGRAKQLPSGGGDRMSAQSTGTGGTAASGAKTGGNAGRLPAGDGNFHAQSADTGGGPVVYEKHWERAKQLPSGGGDRLNAQSAGTGGTGASGAKAGGSAGRLPAGDGNFHAQSADTGGGPVVYEKMWSRAKQLPTP